VTVSGTRMPSRVPGAATTSGDTVGSAVAAQTSSSMAASGSGITYPLPSTATWATSDTVTYGYDDADERPARRRR
jgi:hypothetical protein